MCYDSACTGRSTPTTASNGAILILCLHIIDTLDFCMKKFGVKRLFLIKWQLCELRQFSGLYLIVVLLVL